ncbi:MAG: DUF3376 domain-containing protein, partial [Acidimicrobiia bacterium]|nr:DUF3376 domain-containing protein [Acidimicrobiia bacterium]
NFGAFFSARWRANDWMWGRLDSAQSLVDLLADSTRWFGRGGPEVGADEVRARIEAAVKTPFTTDGDRSWGSWIDSRWGALEDRVAAELTQAEANPTIPHPLTATKQVLIERLQAEVMASMLPWVNATPAGEAPDPPSPTSTASRMQTAEQAADLRAGIEKIPSDMEPVRWSRIGMRLGLNAWLALKPTNKLLRVLVTPLKPLYLFVLAIAVFPRRALLAGIVGFAALAVGRWELPTGKNPMFDDLVARRLNPDGYLTWQRVAAAVITVLLAGLLVYIHHLAVRQPQWSRQIRFVEWTAAVVGVVMAACTVVLVIAEVSLPPGIMPVAAVLVVAIAMHWMRPDRWLLCMVIAVAPYLALLPLVGAVDWIDAGWWALLSFGLAVTLTTIYVTFVDVFPARPRMTEDPG